ncbi:hypothetical protein BIW11_06260 [Tropilaelaps mercedesae]|uniref:Uncharacterized protein n=1 Tax=Tropilaelaps mercedesae TaxID=418985 RepID=A0A1V9XYU7_9ACAR|nr:hypothetical protein BIW11_06260 [Tropilaelaps mercedesae]
MNGIELKLRDDNTLPHWSLEPPFSSKTEKGFSVAPVVPVSNGSSSHYQSSLDKGAHQATALSDQGSASYDHGAQSSKKFGNKESSGTKENYAYSAGNTYKQRAGSFSHSDEFNKAAQLNTGIGKHFQQTGDPGLTGAAPTVPGVSGASIPIVPAGALLSSVDKHQHGTLAKGYAQGQGSSPYNQDQSTLAIKSHRAPKKTIFLPALTMHQQELLVPVGVVSSPVSKQQHSSITNGRAQGQGSFSYNKGRYSVRASGNQETFGNKKSLGNESSQCHRTAQNAHSQSSQFGHHDKAHQVTFANQRRTAVR